MDKLTRNPPMSRKSMVRQAAFVIVILLIARFLWMRDRPERLIRGPNTNYTISGDTLYMIVGVRPSKLGQANVMAQASVIAQSINSGRRRVIGPVALGENDTFYYNSSWSYKELGIADGKLYYAVTPRTKPGISQGGGGSWSFDQFLGTFLMPSSSLRAAGHPGEKRARSAPAPLPSADVRFRQVSIQGGVPRDIVALRGENFCMMGDHVFWVRPGADERVMVTRAPQADDPIVRVGGQVIRKRTFWFEETAHSDLMLTSLKDGSTHCLRHGIPRSTFFIKGEAGIVWEEPMPYPDLPLYFYARVSDGYVHSLGSSISGHSNYRNSVEFKGRIYWDDYLFRDGGGGVSTVRSANLDGTDIRTVLAEKDRHPFTIGWLRTYQGNLYCCLAEATTDPKGHVTGKGFLCRLHPDRSDPIEIMHKLPDGSSPRDYILDEKVDGGYLYFTRREQVRSLWAILFDDPPSNTDTIDTLYRIPLDH